MNTQTDSKQTDGAVTVRSGDLLAAARALCKKMDAIHNDPLYQAVWACAWSHGVNYADGPTYEQEFKDLKAAVWAANGSITDSERLDKLGQYLSDPAKNISGPFKEDYSWQFGYNGGDVYIIDGQGNTLREAIDSLPSATLLDAPVRLCCGQRHFGPVCPDGMVMCCLCFKRVSQDELNIASNGQKEDVCKECAKLENTFNDQTLPQPPDG